MIVENEQSRREARSQRIEEEKRVLDHASKVDQDAHDPSKKRNTFHHQSVLSNAKKYDPKEQSTYNRMLARQLEERERKDVLEKQERTKPNDSIVNMLGRPGHGAPLVADLRGEGQQEGSLVTHLHHLGTGNDDLEMQKYAETAENRDRLRNILDRHQQHRLEHPEQSTESPSRLPQVLNNPSDPQEFFDPDLKSNARVFTELTRGPGHILNNIHERKTDNYFEFGLPGGGAPRLRNNNNNNNTSNSEPLGYQDMVDSTLPSRPDGKTVSKESARAYALTLDQARQQKQDIMAKLARDEQEEQAKLDREHYNPFGRPGAGAPLDPQSKKAALEAQKQQAQATVDPKVMYS